MTTYDVVTPTEFESFLEYYIYLNHLFHGLLEWGMDPLLKTDYQLWQHMSKDPVYSLFATETLIPMVEEAKRVIRNDLVSSCNTYTGLFALPHLITGRTTASYAPIQLDSVMIAHTHLRCQYGFIAIAGVLTFPKPFQPVYLQIDTANTENWKLIVKDTENETEKPEQQDLLSSASAQ